MAETQMRVGIVAPQHRDVAGCSLAVDKKGRVVLPKPEDNGRLFDEVISLAHQGDHFHRSSEDTARTLLTSFSVDGWSDTKTPSHPAVRVPASRLRQHARLRGGSQIPVGRRGRFESHHLAAPIQTC